MKLILFLSVEIVRLLLNQSCIKFTYEYNPKSEFLQHRLENQKNIFWLFKHIICDIIFSLKIVWSLEHKTIK